MSHYEGPTYQPKKSYELRKFNRLSENRSSKEAFEPAFSKGETAEIHIRKRSADPLKDDQQPVLDSSLEHYQIPYLKRQKPKTKAQQVMENLNQLDDQAVKKEGHSSTKRYLDGYQPSYQKEPQKAKAKLKRPPVQKKPAVQAQEAQGVVTTAKNSYEEIQDKTREIAKRLVKNNDTFLLFEN